MLFLESTPEFCPPVEHTWTCLILVSTHYGTVMALILCRAKLQFFHMYNNLYLSFFYFEDLTEETEQNEIADK